MNTLHTETFKGHPYFDGGDTYTLRLEDWAQSPFLMLRANSADTYAGEWLTLSPEAARKLITALERCLEHPALTRKKSANAE